MQAEAAGEQPVAVGDLQDVVGRSAAAGQRPRDGFGPEIDVLARVADDRRLAGGAGRGVNANDVAQGNGEKAEGICVAEVVFDRKREFPDVVEGPNVLRLHAMRIEFFPVERDILVRAPNRVLQTFALEAAQLIALHALEFFAVDHGALTAQALSEPPSGIRNAPFDTQSAGPLV